MNIIIPMAGMGKRMRPHTLTMPKPLIPVAGKPIVEHLLEDLIKVCPQKVEQIAYVTGRFGKEVEEKLITIAQSLGAKAGIYYQDNPLGTAHAILCAKAALKGPVMIAFADTLFRTDAIIDSGSDGTIWVKSIDDPRQFGVVTVNADNVITGFVEKPDRFVSDLAIIGIYYFRDGENLCSELQYLIDHDIKDKGEYQLTSAMENMKNKGKRFVPGRVAEWLDCGNKDATVFTNRRLLELKYPAGKVDTSAQIIDSVILHPCFIDRQVRIEHSIIGPFVSVGASTQITSSRIRNSILQNNTVIESAVIDNSMIGSHVIFKGRWQDLNLGDYTAQS